MNKLGVTCCTKFTCPLWFYPSCFFYSLYVYRLL